MQKVAYFLFKDSSSPVKASDFNPLNPDLLTLYRRPNTIKIWPTYAVPPTTTLYPAQHTTCGERDHPRLFWQPLEKLIPLTTTSQSGPDQPPLNFRPTYALPDQGPLIAVPSIFQSGGWSALWCERAFSNTFSNHIYDKLLQALQSLQQCIKWLNTEKKLLEEFQCVRGMEISAMMWNREK